MPAGMPISRASKMAQTASSMVAGNSVMDPLRTGSCVISDLPRSPLSTRPISMPHCTSTGLSRPNSLSRWAWRIGSMPRSPARVSIGSPGTLRIRKNASRVRPRNVGTTRLRRVKTKRSIDLHYNRRKGAWIGW